MVAVQILLLGESMGTSSGSPSDGWPLMILMVQISDDDTVRLLMAIRGTDPIFFPSLFISHIFYDLFIGGNS
jgi:hypothetical protein